MERIANGYQLAEAPLATDDGGVIFSDVLGGGVRRWSPGTAEVETVLPKRRARGGTGQHADGGRVTTGRDVIHVDDPGPGGGQATTNRTVWAGEDVTGRNDLTVDPDGNVVVGLLHFRPFSGAPAVPGEFVRVAAD